MHTLLIYDFRVYQWEIKHKSSCPSRLQVKKLQGDVRTLNS
jgi:hypothetical protein